MALTTNINYLQPTGFKLVISRDNYANIEYFAQTVTHPGSSVTPVELPTSRVTRIPFAGDKVNYGEMTAEILLDEQMSSYKEMHAWLERIVNDGHVPYDTIDKKATAADITVIILSSSNNKSVQIRYKDCVPTDLTQINFAANVQDVAYTTFTASFRFSTFEIL